MKRSTGEFPSDTLTLKTMYKCQKKAIRFQTFLVRPEVSFIVKAEELTEDLQNFLDELEKDGNTI